MAIGLDHDAALRLAIRCAHDSIPPLRLQLLTDIAANPMATTSEIRHRLNKPISTSGDNWKGCKCSIYSAQENREKDPIRKSE